MNPGLVFSLHICPGHRQPMIPRASVEVQENLGLMGDRHAIRDSARQVLLVEHETLQQADLAPGTIRENITTMGIALATLSRGQRLQVGSAVLTITKRCDPCSRLEEIRKGLSDELRGKRGFLAQVTRSGMIGVNDPIILLP